jgi:hypothetical protein
MENSFCKFAAIILVTAICTPYSFSQTKKGNGNIMISEISVPAFDKIKCTATSLVDVRFYASEEYRVVVNIDSNLYEYAEIYARNNVLNIGTQKGQKYKFTKFSIDVYCPVLKGVSISGACSFEGIDKITGPAFAADISGYGKLKGKFECEYFSVTFSGSGRIAAAGICRDANISISGYGRFDGMEFETNNATVEISGAGKASIGVSDNLKANLSGFGKITYRGEPKINSKVSGFGRIKKSK